MKSGKRRKVGSRQEPVAGARGGTAAEAQGVLWGRTMSWTWTDGSGCPASYTCSVAATRALEDGGWLNGCQVHGPSARTKNTRVTGVQAERAGDMPLTPRRRESLSGPNRGSELAESRLPQLGRKERPSQAGFQRHVGARGCPQGWAGVGSDRQRASGFALLGLCQGWRLLPTHISPSSRGEALSA